MPNLTVCEICGVLVTKQWDKAGKKLCLFDWAMIHIQLLIQRNKNEMDTKAEENML